MEKKSISALTDAQLGMYLECVDESNTATYLIPLAFCFDSRMDAGKLAEAFARVAACYRSFSTVIHVVNAEPVMAPYGEELPRLPILTVTEEEAEQRKAALFRPFAFDGSLLWRGEILVTPKQVILSLVFSHLIFDGTSIAVLNHALARAYDGEALSEDGTVWDAKIRETEMLAGETAKDAEAYFSRYLDGMSGDSSPISDKNPGEANIPSTAEYVVPMDEATLKGFAKSLGVTENVVFLSAFAYTLGKFNNQTEVVFSSVESGRFGGGYDNSIGMFVKSFPLRFALDEQTAAGDFIRGVKQNYFDTLKHNYTKYSGLVKEYTGCGDVHFIYQGEMFKGIPVGGITPSVNVLDTYEPVSNMDMLVYKENGVYKLWLGYKSALYTREMMDCFVDMYLTVLEQMPTEKKLESFSFVSAHTQTVLDERNATDLPFDRNLTVGRMFDSIVARYPQNPAVSYLGKTYTYAELSSLVNKLAAYVHKKGIGKDEAVSVLIPRNEYMPICAFGIIKAGAAYQPLDPTYPTERLNFMVSDCGAKLLIADRSLISLVEYHGDVLYTDEIASLPEAEPLTLDGPDHAVLLIYTSGTTGTPKGCILENHNIVAFHHHHKMSVELSEQAKVATIASFGFDAAAMDILTSVLSGAELCVIPDDIKLDIPQLEKFYCEHGITNGFMTTQLGRMFLEHTQCKTLKHFVLGGEKLVPFTPPSWVMCHNDYGPSETIAYICGFVIRDNSLLQPIGKPSSNTKLYIADCHNRLLPPGACGELCIAGLQVGRGYLNRPEKTAEAFVRNPFCTVPGYTHLYKTGDVVRMLPDGNYDFIGRRDGQVKIRGFRIELTEIEQVIRDYPGIKNATVQAYDDGGTGKYVAAFIVSDETVDIDALNAFIAERKPPYMVPAVTMQIDAIPVNANSKVDKRKLPKPERKFGEVVKPQTETQQQIFDVVADIVGTSEFGIDTDFYLAGLSSIGSIRLCTALAEKFGKTVQMKDIRQNSTVKKLEEFFGVTETAEASREVLSDYPLTKTQEGIFVECIGKPDSTFYNIPLLLKLSDEVDITKLKAAIVTAINAHPYWKTELFTNEQGNVRQKRQDSVPFTVTDIEECSSSSLDAAKAVLPFTLTGGRLFRIKLFVGEKSFLFLEFHHIIADGTSIRLFLRQIERAYQGETLAPEAYNSFDLALDEETNRATPMLAEAKKYYGAMLADLDMNFLPCADRLPAAPKANGKLITDCQSVSVSHIAEFCAEHKISVNGLLCSAFGFVLAKYAGTEYSVFNTVYNGRKDSRYAETVGMLVKTLPVVCRIDRDSTLDIAKDITDQLIDSMSNDLYSFAEISNDCGVNSDIVFIYQGDSFRFDTFCGHACEEIEVNLSDEKAPLALQVVVVGDRLRYIAEYDADLFTEQLILSVLGALDQAIASFLDGEEIRHVSLVTDEMARRMDEYNATESAYDTSKTIPALFAEQAKSSPDRLCVVYQNKSYTYGEAFDLASRVGFALAGKGIGAGDIVAILIPRDENMVFSAQGAVMSGAAYVGVDPTYPAERIAFMLQDSGARAVIVDRSLSNLLGDFGGEILYTDEFASLPKASPAFLAGLATVTPDDRALVIYSSGTTGTPKGAVLCHKNIVAFFHNYSLDMNVREDTHVAMYASFGFDGGAMDVFCCPMAGATLYIVPTDIRMDLEKLEQFYIQNRINTGFMTTQVGTMFIANTQCKSLTRFQVGGEKFIPTLAPSWIRFYNSYGPSETMCYVNKYLASDTGTLQPIGRNNRNVKEYILDKFGNRLPFGACGELCISCGQTGQGYLNRPEKTAQSFVSNPFCSVPPYDRMYKTGDIARLMPDGNYDFIGRRDGQVKIRGFRIELTEIEQVMREYDGIRNAVVQAFDSPAGGKFLAAYIVADNPIDIAALNRFIGEKKPSYMIPTITVQIDEIPLTSNGKVDKKKLVCPAMPVSKKGAEPANETEEAICAIYEEVLGLEKVYADDDFFAIGGSSISAIKVVVKCGNAGYNIVFKNLFANPTPHGLSEFIQGCREQTVYATADAQYDYSSLACNTVEHVDEITYNDIGDVLLTGSTGFLGSHILKELLDNTASRVICLVRGKGDMDAQTRFQMMMTYYFEDWYTEEKQKRVTVVDGELGDVEVLAQIKSMHFDTIINSAANVKHFAAGDQLLTDNFSGVENLIALAEATKTVLVQISSTSVSGEAVKGKISDDFLFRENQLNIGQSLENKYIYSKYMAEQAVIDAISRGRIRGKIIRLGNLMARINDSEFQINAGSSGFLKQFSGYRKLMMFPVNMMDKEIEFSPIDSTAKAVVLLSGTPEKFTVFHAKNCNAIHYGYFIQAMKKEGIDIRIVPDKVFADNYKKALQDDSIVTEFSSLIAYQDNNSVTMHQIESDATFTTKALYRLGFAWPLISSDYLEKMVKTLIDLGFFA